MQPVAADAAAVGATAMQVLQELGFDAATCAMVCQQVRFMQLLALPVFMIYPAHVMLRCRQWIPKQPSLLPCLWQTSLYL